MAAADTQTVHRILVVEHNNEMADTIVRVLSPEFVLQVAGSVEIGLKMLEQRVDMVICQLHMPRMNGYQFLLQAKRMQPGAIRVMLTERPEDPLAVRALYENIASTCLPMQGAEVQVLACVESLFAVEAFFGNPQLMQRVKALDHLPGGIRACQDIIRAIDAGRMAPEVSDLIEKEQALSAEILRVANSAFYGQRTASTRRAVLYMGLGNIRNMVVTHIAYQISALKSRTHPITSVCWRTAQYTRQLLELQYTGTQVQADATLSCAALLCNLGNSLYAVFYGEELPQYTQLYYGEAALLLAYEKRCMDVTHAEFAACLLNWWGLPYGVVEAALYHHTPLHGDIIHKQLVAQVALCAQAADAAIVHRTTYTPDPQLLEAAEFEAERFREICAQMTMTE